MNNESRLNRFPRCLLIQIFTYLEPQTIVSILQTCTTFHTIIEEKLWKPLSLRDFSQFLYTKPLSQVELAYPTKESDIKEVYEDEAEASKTITDPSQDPLTESEMQMLNKAIGDMYNWKRFYIHCYGLPDLNGYWVGNYGGHGHELIRVYQKGYKVYAKKLMGDPNIPSGKLTWRMTLNGSLAEGKGEIHLADSGFKNPRWSTAYIDVTEKNLIQITWFAQDSLGYWCSLMFGNVRAGCKEFDIYTTEEQINYIDIEYEV